MVTKVARENKLNTRILYAKKKKQYNELLTN